MTQLKADKSPWPRRQAGPSKADERYNQIYESAARLFYEKGYASTSLQDLANAVGLQKGSLYHYIDSKEDLLFGITEYAHSFFVELLNGVEELELTPLEKIERMVRLHVEFAAEHFHVTAAFYNDRSALSKERQLRVVDTRDAYENKLRCLIKDGQDAGQIAKDLDPKIAAFGLLGMVNWINQWYKSEGALTPRELADAFTTMCIRALLPPVDERPAPSRQSTQDSGHQK